MTTFDQIVPILQEVLTPYSVVLQQLESVIVNRDLNGRVRLILPEQAAGQAAAALDEIARALSQRLGCHAFPPEQMLLFEPNMAAVLQGVAPVPLPGVEGVQLVDRLASE